MQATIGNGSAVGTIRDDDPLLSVGDASTVETASGAHAVTFAVSISQDPVVPVTAHFATADGTAFQDIDYLFASGDLTFTPGGPTTQNVTVFVQGDVVNEVHETFVVNLSAPTDAALGDGQGVGTIVDDDGPKFAVSDVSVVEGAAGTAAAVFTVSLTEASPNTLHVSWATANGTALAGQDYQSAGGVIDFAPGELSHTVSVAVSGDALDELDETFVVNLSGSTAPIPILDAQGIATIVDDDSAMFGIDDVSVPEGSYGWINDRQWQGVAWVTPVTGEGYHQIRVSGAVAADDPWLVSGYDVGRFRFQVKTLGVASMNLQADGREGAINLSWQQDDYDLIAGYNLYRADSLTGTYTRLNATIIPVGGEHFVDTGVAPAVPKFYKFTVVTTDQVESTFSNAASAAAIDTVAPTIAHATVTAAAPGVGLTLTATLADNLAVTGGAVHYRPAGGTGAYVTLNLVNTSGTTWRATIPGGSMTAPGIDYYLTATDGIGTAYHGTPAAPHTVVVQNTPTVASVAPGAGPIQGGQVVTVSGSLFQPGASVLFGGAPATGVVVLSPNQITCTTPAHAPAQVDVKVVNGDGSQATLLNGFRFQDQGVVVSLPTLSADKGATVEVPIVLSNVAGLRAADLTVAFGPTVLSAVGARVGPLATGWALSSNLATPGKVTLSLASATTVTGNGVVAYVTFAVVGNPTTQTPLTITGAVLNDGAITSSLSAGTFTVNDVFSLTGGVTYYNGGAPVPGVRLDLVGVGARNAVTAANGQFSFAGVSTGAYTLTPSKADDATDVTSFDASLVLQAAAGNITLSANQALAADVNRNGTVTSMDASYIMERAVGLLTAPLPGAGRVWDFVPRERAYPLLNGNLTGQDFGAVLLGDVSGNWQASQVGSSSSGGGVGLSVRPVEASAGRHVSVPVEVNRGGAALYAADLVLTYDPAQLVLEGVEFAAAAAGMLSAVNAGQPGVIRLALAGADPLAADGTLLRVRFVVVGSLAEPAAVAISSARLNEGALAATLGSAEVFARPPTVAAAGFDFQRGDALRFTFSEDVADTVDLADIALTNRDTGQVVTAAAAGLAMTLEGGPGQPTTATWVAAARLPDGNYRATLAAGAVGDAAGNGLASAYAIDFFSLAGDATRDRAVDFNDLVPLAQNYNASGGKTWADGDFTGDGNVDFNDLVKLAQNYNTSLAGAPAAAGSPPSFDAAMAAAFASAPTVVIPPPVSSPEPPAVIPPPEAKPKPRLGVVKPVVAANPPTPVRRPVKAVPKPVVKAAAKPAATAVSVLATARPVDVPPPPASPFGTTRIKDAKRFAPVW